MTARLAPILLSILALGACEQAPVQEDDKAAIESAANVIAPMPPAATATALPALTGRVVDNANLLSPAQEAELVTVPSLNGQAIEAFGMALGNRWRIGQRGKDNGVLLIVAPAEREVRIAVGRGLEAILTNDRARAIVERDILPAFRDDNFGRGIAAGTHQIAATLLAAENQPRGRRR